MPYMAYLKYRYSCMRNGRMPAQGSVSLNRPSMSSSFIHRRKGSLDAWLSIELLYCIKNIQVPFNLQQALLIPPHAFKTSTHFSSSITFRTTEKFCALSQKEIISPTRNGSSGWFVKISRSPLFKTFSTELSTTTPSGSSQPVTIFRISFSQIGHKTSKLQIRTCKGQRNKLVFKVTICLSLLLLAYLFFEIQPRDRSSTTFEAWHLNNELSSSFSTF